MLALYSYFYVTWQLYQTKQMCMKHAVPVFLRNQRIQIILIIVCAEKSDFKQIYANNFDNYTPHYIISARPKVNSLPFFKNPKKRIRFICIHIVKLL